MTLWQTILARHPRVLLCGRSGAGKTTLSRQAGRQVFNCGEQGKDGDTPPEVSFEDNPRWWVERLQATDGPWLMEGTGSYRIARTGLRDFGWEPDAVVHLHGRYLPDDIPAAQLPADPDEAERKRSRAIARAAGHMTIWRSYLEVRALKNASAVVYEGNELDMAGPDPEELARTLAAPEVVGALARLVGMVAR